MSPAASVICPDCRGALTRASDGHLVCVDCGRRFDSLDGVDVLLPSRMSSITRAEVEYWDGRTDRERESISSFYSKNHFMADKWGLYSYKDDLVRLPADASILEVGSGTHPKLIHLVKFHGFSDLTVSDLSPQQLSANREYCVLNRLNHRVRHVAADMTALPFPDQAFDAVCVHAALHHVPDRDTAVSEMVRCLRPGGKLIIGHEPNERIVGLQRKFADKVKIGEKHADSTYSVADDELQGLVPRELTMTLERFGMTPIRIIPQWFVQSFVRPLPMLLNKAHIRVEKLPEPVLSTTRWVDGIIALIPGSGNWSAHFTVIASKPAVAQVT